MSPIPLWQSGLIADYVIVRCLGVNDLVRRLLTRSA